MPPNLTQLGRYQIESLIGAGAFAEVYKATDSLLKRTVALKVLKPALLADTDAFERFLQEAQTAASLFHPGIATVLDLGEADGRYFLAMRYIDGQSLAQRIEDNGALGWEESLSILRQLAAALDFSHERGLVHRDIKPGNILVSPSEGAVLTDFGLVRAMESSGLSTRTGSILGTPQYIPPEIWKGKPATPQADQYALACVLVEMLSGQVLFEGPTPWAIMAAHAAQPSLPQSWPEGAPSTLKETLVRALAQEPEERFASCTQWVELLEKRPAISVLDASPPAEPSQPAAKPANEMSITLGEGVQMIFVRIPAGVFWMGSSDNDPDAFPDEKPIHKVYLDEYWIGKSPVTNRQYGIFAKTVHIKGWTFQPGKEDHPAVEISWQDALNFCHWLSQVSGEAIRLPAEAEWEKAARGADRRLYPWGNQAPDKNLANSNNIYKSTTPVGQFSPPGDSPYGCADMAGNVWEWVNDWYAETYYAKSPDSHPKGPDKGKFKVLRGGSWNYASRNLRVALRFRNNPGNRSDYSGFRCAR